MVFMSESCCQADKVDLKKELNATLKKVFWIVLVINLAMFFVEAIGGYLAHSNALLADSLDMLSDAFVYGLSLFVLAKSHEAKVKASLVKGVLMGLLGLFVVGEAFYKIFHPLLPIGEIVSVIGVIALIANVVSLLLIIKHKNTDLNVKSAWICSRNDVMSNASVIVAGLLVVYFNSMWPDILIGLVIAFVVLGSSLGIIKEALRETKNRV